MNHVQLALIGPVLKQKVITSYPQIAVDGGIRFATNPILWVGDGDSGEIKSELVMVRKPNQDETDLRFCLKEIHQFGWKQLHLYGFLGKRKDHEFANLGEVCQELATRPEDCLAIFYDDNSHPHVYLFPTGGHSIKIKGQFSILSFEKTIITISGECEYQMKDQALLPFSGRGVSNVGHGEVFIQSSAPLMLIIGNGIDE